ncbi:hypothetical protein GCM10028791_31440 [Echinicola sediminis]
MYALKQVNTPYDEQQPVISSKEELFLSVAFHPGNTGGSKDFGDVWYSKKNEFNQWQEAKPVASLSTTGYDLLIGFPDDNTALVYHDGKKKTHGIHQYRRTGETDWQYEHQLDFGSFKNNGKSFSARLHPSGEILVMSMNSYGSYGNEDIYVSFRQSGRRWSVPKNIGPVVNSFEQEMTPFLSIDKQVLYFSANGHGTGEGRDIFYSQRLDDSWERWTAPKRLNDDVNSRGVELSYFIDPNSPYTAFVTTTQDSEGYGDILMRRKEEIVLEEPPISSENRFLASSLPVRASEPTKVSTVSRGIQSESVNETTQEKVTATQVVEEELVEAAPVSGEALQEESKAEIPAEEVEATEPERSEPKEIKKEMVEAEVPEKTEAAILENESISVNVLDIHSKAEIPYKVSFQNSEGTGLGTETGLSGQNKLNLREGTVKVVVSSTNYLPETLTVSAFRANNSLVLLTPAKSGTSLILNEILFAKGTAQLADENSLNYIHQLVGFLKDHPALKIRLEGHTDNIGNAKLNKQLSMERAKTIRDYMVKQGVDFERIRLRGLGGDKPITSNDTQEGREQNRRVEMVIID